MLAVLETSTEMNKTNHKINFIKYLAAKQRRDRVSEEATVIKLKERVYEPEEARKKTAPSERRSAKKERSSDETWRSFDSNCTRYTRWCITGGERVCVCVELPPHTETVNWKKMRRLISKLKPMPMYYLTPWGQTLAFVPMLVSRVETRGRKRASK